VKKKVIYQEQVSDVSGKTLICDMNQNLPSFLILHPFPSNLIFISVEIPGDQNWKLLQGSDTKRQLSLCRGVQFGFLERDKSTIQRRVTLGELTVGTAPTVR